MGDTTSRVLFISPKPDVVKQSQRLVTSGSPNRTTQCTSSYFAVATPKNGPVGHYLAECSLRTPTTPEQLKQQLKLQDVGVEYNCSAGAMTCFANIFPGTSFAAIAEQEAVCLLNEVPSSYAPPQTTITCWTDSAALASAK